MATGRSKRKYQIVIFGASGFTGQFVVEEVARTIAEESGDLKWAVAGRDKRKLQSVLAEASKYTGKDLSKIDILIADVKNENSLNEMSQQAEVILNCVGPYRFYGDPVVRSCVENGAHHLDISGEPGFLEKVQLVYEEKAQQNGVYVVGSCGFDSIPCDMGVVYTTQQFTGDVNDIECFLQVHTGPQGGRLNFATWQSAIHGFANAHETKEIRRRLFPNRLPKSNHPIAKRALIYRSKHKQLGGWCLPFVGSDRSVVSRTQHFNYEHKTARPVQFNAYFNVPNILVVAFLILLGIVFGVCAKFRMGRYLLEKYPRLMSGGLFSTTGPTRKQIEGSSFSFTMVAHGYDAKLGDLQEQHRDTPNRKVTTKVSGPEAGYVTTPICLVQAAYTLLAERENLPKGGGVYTPGAAFAQTSLIDRLSKHNVKFSTI